MKIFLRFLLGIFRVVMTLPTIVAILIMLTLVGFGFAWWNFVALVGLLGGKRGMFWVGRFLGCYPTLYLLLGLLWLAAFFRWLMYGFKIMATYRDMCADCLDKLEEIEGLQEIGGLWGEWDEDI